ncbi:ester hydrolase C11orf54 homolog [Aethina tumida]|uniref:ester hydrolase C11orf54 homolog n=1 Tax=Aethina tumida TaxID=116153 RepID=UPI0021497F9B|nr:ester hydrolase C11orf54 homolog [Aethina tumida]
MFYICLIFMAIFRTSTGTMSLDPRTLPVEKRPLYVPPLNELVDVLNKSLKNNFQEVKVELVDCPDLTKQPFTLASEGLSGNETLVEIGGPPFLAPLVQRDKVYDLKDIAKLVDSEPAFIIGAGAGPHPYVGKNCEGIYNLKIENGKVDQQTRISKTDDKDDKSIQEQLPNSESRVALLANLFFSEGKPGKVLKVYARKRIGNDDFIASIRKSLKDGFKDRLVGLGGAFVMKTGKAKQHVMPDFSKTPLKSDDDINNWLNFYTMSAPLIALGTLVNGEGPSEELDLRVQHFHSFSHHGEAGHYHIDTTPDIVEYLGYFKPGQTIYRIDKPVDSHKFGRD